jgi:maltose alpha-D-glucosyltransferase/alpha-amylase
MKQSCLTAEQDPLWYQDAIIYELHVRAFHDSDGDGIGDFRGLTAKLDYLQDLGVTALWLLPFYPSPLQDDGYDIADYTGVHPHYGALRDFKTFLNEAHRRGLRIIIELVLNHTSTQHPWFQRARRASAGSRWRNFYVWSETPNRYTEARIIFQDFEPSNWAWDPVANAYYWHRFYAHQPDLNYDNPDVRRAVRRVLDFWLRLGVDGLRLDAVPYLYEREGTICENLPETHAFLQELRHHVDQAFGNRMFLAEANQWPEDAVAYFGTGNECHMAFHFPLMPRLFMAMHREDRFPILDILQQTPAIPETCQWALFLRNHDELTLEMVTDEERDYMYRVYAHDRRMRINLGIRRRLAPLLENDRRMIELMNGLLFSLPGTPILYYGDEIGMGDNFYLGDRNSVRTPMQWSPDRNGGFSQANPQQLYLPLIIDPEYHYEAVNVETQQKNPHSLLWWMKHLISLRKRYQAFGRGTLEFLHPENRKILAFMRRYQDESLLVVANLSPYAQGVELDLSAFQGMVPFELFGRTRFPPIGERPYFLTPGAHTFYWFALEPQRLEATVTSPTQLPTLTVSGRWDNVFRRRDKQALEAVLPDYLRRCDWFGGKARPIQAVELTEMIPVPVKTPVGFITLVRVEYTEGEPETYVLPLTCAMGGRMAQMQDAQSVVAHLRISDTAQDDHGVLYDAMTDTRFLTALFRGVSRGQRFAGTCGAVQTSRLRAFRSLLQSARDVQPALVKSRQSNTSVVYGNQFILKLYRRLGEGINPDVKIGRYLTEKRQFPNIAPLACSLEYYRNKEEPMTLAILQRFVVNQGDAWHSTLETLGRYFKKVLAQQDNVLAIVGSQKPLLALLDEDLPGSATELFEAYLETARLLGQRTGEVHVALAQAPDDSDFAPETFTDFYRRSLYHGLLSQANRTLQLLRRNLEALPTAVQEKARQVLEQQAEIRQRFQALRDSKIMAMRLRCHGDYHLGQVLLTGNDAVIIDFEGKSGRPVSVRHIKRSPLVDVAGMLRSFHYAAYTPLFDHAAGLRPEDVASLEPWARFWSLWVSVVFLKAYLGAASPGGFLPRAQDQLQALLDAYLLEKLFDELSEELTNRPDWVKVPLCGILQLLQAA